MTPNSSWRPDICDAGVLFNDSSTLKMEALYNYIEKRLLGCTNRSKKLGRFFNIDTVEMRGCLDAMLWARIEDGKKEDVKEHARYTKVSGPRFTSEDFGMPSSRVWGKRGNIN
jgi:hypothetical protein